MAEILYQNWTTYQTTLYFLFETWWQSQTFTPAITHQITSVDVKVYKASTPGTIDVEIYNVISGGGDDGKPDITGGAIATGSYDGNSITSDSAGEEVNIVLTGGPTLLSGTRYALVQRLDDEGLGGAAAIYWKGDNLEGYSRGANYRSTNSGSTWSVQSVDLFFREYGPGDANPVNVTGTIAATSAVSGAVEVAKVLNVTGTIAAVSTVSGAVEILSALELSGTISAVSTVSGAIIISSQTSTGWPLGRRSDYDEDLVYDEDTRSWYNPTSETGVTLMAIGGGRYNEQLVVISEQGRIYYGAI
jgi:hypothetical protein